MSALKWLFAILAVAIALAIFFNINILQNKTLLLVFSGILVLLLVLSFFEMIGRLFGIIITIAAFLFLLYLLLAAFKLLSL